MIPGPQSVLGLEIAIARERGEIVTPARPSRHSSKPSRKQARTGKNKGTQGSIDMLPAWQAAAVLLATATGVAGFRLPVSCEPFLRVQACVTPPQQHQHVMAESEEPPAAAEVVRAAESAVKTPGELAEEAEVAREMASLIEDDEWLGLAMEMAIVVRCAVRESLKKNVKAFTSKDTYNVGDISKEADARIKAQVAELRGKSEYELGDLSMALDQIAKDGGARTKRTAPGPYHPRALCPIPEPQIRRSLTCTQRSAN